RRRHWSPPGCSRRQTPVPGRSPMKSLPSSENASWQTWTCLIPKGRSTPPPPVPESSVSFEREDPHLCWRPHLGVLRPDREKAHRILESLCHPVCPVQKFLSRPLEAVIAVAQLSDGHGWKLHVVFHVWRRPRDWPGPREFEKHAFESRQPGRILVLDYLHYRGGVEPGEALVSVGQRAMHQPDSLALHARQILQA